MPINLASVSPELYTKKITFQAEIGGYAVEVHSKPGIEDCDAIQPVTLLLGSVIDEIQGKVIIQLGCGAGALSAVLCKQAGRLQLYDNDLIALQMAQKTLAENGLANFKASFDIDVPTAEKATCDAAVIEIPKGRKNAQRWLLMANQALKPGGRLYLAGANRAGIKPILQDAAMLFGDGAIQGYKKGSRVSLFHKRESASTLPEWAFQPGVQPGSWQQFEITTRGHSFNISSLPGVFSYDRLDEGTQLLLEAMPNEDGAAVLDIGCGYGILGMLAAKSAAHVDLVDSNLLAVASAQKNIQDNQLQNARALPGDITSSVRGSMYDLVLSNPPFHAGRNVDYSMALAIIHQAKDVLREGGQLWVVTNSFIPYEGMMNKVFGNVQTALKTNKYSILFSSAN